MKITPNMISFAGGAIAVLIGALVLKGDEQGNMLVLAGVFAMGNALKGPTQIVEDAKAKRASMAPPPEKP